MMQDLISRQAAIDAVHKEFDDCIVWDESGMTTANEVERILDSAPSAQPEIIRCRDCKYFELDHFEKVGGVPIPIIVAHEICMKWGEGCKSSIDGWCFMAERRKNG